LVTQYRTDIWDRQAALEGPEHEVAMWGSKESQVGRLIRAVEAAGVEPGDSVLDWGCGTGVLADLVPECDYLGMDPSEEMVKRARALRPHREFELLTYPPRHFDHIFAIACWGISPWTEWDTYGQIRELAKTGCRSFTTCLRTKKGTEDEHVGHAVRCVAELAESLSECWVLDRSYHPRELLLVMKWS
jgi:cyclopropane fatty-acyl-phospholipid synthase-like methyltransferase